MLYDDSFNWFTKMCLRAHARGGAGAWSRRRTRAGCRWSSPGTTPPTSRRRTWRPAPTSSIVGEAEITLGELLERLGSADGGEPAALSAAGRRDEIPGLVFRQRGFVRRTGPRKLLQDLDQLPLPAWDLVDVERYRAFWRARHGYFSLNVVTTRGCPYLCNWCAKPVYGNTYHTRSPANVVAEIRLLRERYAPDHLWFCDDILGLKARWLVAWSEGDGRARGWRCRSSARRAPT